jgi:hypothetical protein
MASPHAEAFMSALQQAERTGDVAGLVRLFTDDAELSDLADPEPHTGKEGARAYWCGYLAVFDCVCSRFTGVTESPGCVALEWVSEGSLHSGAEFCYRGVSLLETDETGHVRRFRTYHDSAALRAAAVAHS